jgi:replicative DNA helicase
VTGPTRTAGPAAPSLTEPSVPRVPSDVEAERAVLGAILLNPDVATPLLALLKPDHFYRPWHGQVLHAAQVLHRSGRPVDPIAVHDELRRQGLRGDAARSNGVAIHDLLAAVPVTASGPYYARIVLEQAARRRLLQAGVKLVQLAQHPPAGPGDLDQVMRDVVQELACVRAAVDTFHRTDRPIDPPTRSDRSTRPVGPEAGRSLHAVGPDQ